MGPRVEYAYARIGRDVEEQYACGELEEMAMNDPGKALDAALRIARVIRPGGS